MTSTTIEGIPPIRKSDGSHFTLEVNPDVNCRPFDERRRSREDRLMLKFVPSLEDPEDPDTVIGEPQDLPEDVSISWHTTIFICAPPPPLMPSRPSVSA
jgi:hypothetical protein